MGPFVAYSIYSSILLLALYVSYKWALAGENQHRYNRMALWAIYAVALLAYPASHIISQMMTTAGNPTVDIQATITGIMLQPEDLSAASQPLYLSILIWTYISGMAAAIIYTVITIFKLCRVINNGDKRHYDTYTLVLTADTRIAPFSWGRYVVMSYPDWDDNGEMILTHELRHIQHMHCIDLMFAQSVCIFQWFNPAAWLMREELKTVHEYQADSAVIASGVNIRDYQMLLIKKAVGARFPSLANSLNHSKLKKRITMMYKSKSSGEQRLKALALMPALGLALMAAALPQAKAAISTIDNSRMLPDKVTNFSSDVKDCAEKPGFMLQVNGEYSITDSVIKAENPISIVIPKDNPDIKNAPKYYIDGKEVSESELNSIKPEDIERISVFRNPDRTCVTLKEEDSFENSHILTPDGKHNSPEITIMVDGKKISKKELKAIKCENIDSISIDKTKDIIYFTLKKTTEK